MSTLIDGRVKGRWLIGILAAKVHLGAGALAAGAFGVNDLAMGDVAGMDPLTDSAKMAGHSQRPQRLLRHRTRQPPAERPGAVGFQYMEPQVPILWR